MIAPYLNQKLPEIITVFKENNIKNAYAFGSVCGEDFSNQSDIDLLINFDTKLSALERGENWWNLFFALEDILKRDVDLLTENSLKNPYFINYLNKSRVLIYEKAS